MQCTVSYCVAASEVSSVYNTPINWVGSQIDSVSNSSILDDSINTISNTTNKVGDWVGSQIDSVSNSSILDDSRYQYHIKHHEQSRRLGRFQD